MHGYKGTDCESVFSGKVTLTGGDRLVIQILIQIAVTSQLNAGYKG